MCPDRGTGGLGVRRLSPVSRALLGNGCGDLQLRLKLLGGPLISLKFRSEGGEWFTKEFRGSYGFSPWKEIHQ